LLLLMIPVACRGLWRLRGLLPVKSSKVRSEQPLDPVRIADLAELASLPKPYDGAPAGAWLQQINGLLKPLCRKHNPHSQ
ncbi:DUF4381 domain-containing protein, partial [Pseudomonas syringae pv. tagetis]